MSRRKSRAPEPTGQTGRITQPAGLSDPGPRLEEWASPSSASPLEAAQMRAVSALATGIAHDLRNILTSIQLETAVLQSAPCQELVGKQLDRLYVLTHALLALAEEPQLHVTPVEMSEILDYVLHLVQGQADVDGARLCRRFGRNLPPVLGNARRLEHLFVLLLQNALHAVAPTGGIVTVTLRHEAERLRVDIRDTGPGILPADLPHVFDPFFTTWANRTGLGLYGARRIVEAHRGEIKIMSKPDQGACVSVWLPIVDLPAHPTPTLQEQTL